MSASHEVVGVLGGTFDPVHLGHLHVARQVAVVFDLGRVFLVPSASPPHKPRGPVASARDRFEMVRLSVAGETSIVASPLEIQRGGTSYTIDTLDVLRAQGLVPLFVLGLDSLADLTTWRQHDRLLSEFDLVAVDRAGSSIDEARRASAATVARRIVPVACLPGAGARVEGGLPGYGGRIFYLAAPAIDVSSSLVRARTAAGAPLDGLVPAPVARYIQEHGLYSKEADR